MSRIGKLVKNLRYMSKVDLRHKHQFEFSPEELMVNTLYYIPNASIARPDVLTAEQTLDQLCKTNKSLVRFGDGELFIIDGQTTQFQTYDEKLVARMCDILKNRNDNLLVGINHWWFYPQYDPCDNELSRDFAMYSMPHCRKNLIPLIDFSTQYCDAAFIGLRHEHNKANDRFFKKIRTLWAGRDIVCVGCRQAHQKIKHNIFDNAASENWVYVPNTNAFSEYDNILESIKHYPTKSIVILMAGATSNVLADDLSRMGYRALDLGHVAKSYDFYMNGTELNATTEKAFWDPDL